MGPPPKRPDLAMIKVGLGFSSFNISRFLPTKIGLWTFDFVGKAFEIDRSKILNKSALVKIWVTELKNAGKNSKFHRFFYVCTSIDLKNFEN